MKNKKKLIIFGNEKMAQLVHFYFKHDTDYDIAGFTVDSAYIKDKEFLGLPVFPFEDIQNTHGPSDYEMFIAIGYKKLNTIRAGKYNEAKAKGYTLASYMCTKMSKWGDTVIGDNCFILENQVFQPDVTVGNNVYIWSGNHFGHDVVIGDHSYLASHIVVSGYVKIGSHCFIGINATLRDQVTIGNQCIIGAGALVTNNVKDGSVLVEAATKLYLLNSDQFERMMDISK